MNMTIYNHELSKGLTMRIEKVISWLIRQIRTAFLTFYPEPNARKWMVLRVTVYCMILNTRQHTLLQGRGFEGG
jgi:hypothetical protein